MKTLSRWNRSRIVSVLFLSAVFLLLFFCNHETDYVADDYTYFFSFADGSRIESIAQIPSSMAAHRLSMNGRVIAHSLVQLFERWPKAVFDPINAAAFVLLLLLIMRLSFQEGKDNVLLLACAFGWLWFLQPDFGQVFLWLTGSVNYLWCGVFCLLWLLPWARRYLSGASPTRFWQLILVLCSFPVGAYSENATVALVAMALFFLLLIYYDRRERPEAWMWLSLLLTLVGFFYMMLAPAEGANKAAEFRFSVLLNNLAENAGFYLRFWPLLLGYGLFYYLSCRENVARRRRLLSLVYLFGSVAGHFVLTFSLYTAGRSTYIGLVLLIAANALLFSALFETRWKKLLIILCVLCLIVSAVQVYTGVRDIRQTHYLLQYNEDFLAECAAKRETSVTLYRPYAQTRYSAVSGLAYLDTEDPQGFPNADMAKYYGLESIIGE